MQIPRNPHPLSAIEFDAICRQINSLKNIDKKAESLEAIKSMIFNLMAGYSCVTRVVDGKYGWRARKNINDTYFETVMDLWYPPVEKLLSYGRLNRDHNPIFYISASHEIATLEMRPALGDMLTILQVKLRDENRLPHLMELGVAEKVSQHKLSSNIRIIENIPFGRKFLGSQENIKKNLAIRSFIAQEMTRVVNPGEEFQYKISIAIAEHLMLSPSIDGVLYPSIAGDGSGSGGGQNMALRPQSADEIYVPDMCWTIRVEEVIGPHPSSYRVRCLKRAKAISTAGEIEW